MKPAHSESFDPFEIPKGLPELTVVGQLPHPSNKWIAHSDLPGRQAWGMGNTPKEAAIAAFGALGVLTQMLDDQAMWLGSVPVRDVNSRVIQRLSPNELRLS